MISSKSFNDENLPKLLKIPWSTILKEMQACLNHLATKFKNLIMREDESLWSFASELNTIANKSAVLEKKYNEKKLVKKLIRCFPIRFESYKAVIKSTMNYNEIQFDKLVGLLMSSELEWAKDYLVKRIVFAANHEDKRVKTRGACELDRKELQ